MNIQYEHYDLESKTYLLDKLKIAGKGHMLDLETIGHFNKSLSQQRRATRAKFVTRWTPTNLRQYELNMAPSPYYPLFVTKLETTEHITQCQLASEIQYRTQAPDVLEENLTKWDTHPKLTTLILTVLSADSNPVFLQQLNSHDPYIQQVIDDQKALGWKLVQLSILAVTWRQY